MTVFHSHVHRGDTFEPEWELPVYLIDPISSIGLIALFSTDLPAEAAGVCGLLVLMLLVLNPRDQR